MKTIRNKQNISHMKTQENAIDPNWCSFYKLREENHASLSLVCHIKNGHFEYFYKYDYLHKDGDIYSTIAATIEECRVRRDKWVQGKNYKMLFPHILNKIQLNKTVHKHELAYQIGLIDPKHIMANCWDWIDRDDMVLVFNQMFGTSIK